MLSPRSLLQGIAALLILAARVPAETIVLNPARDNTLIQRTDPGQQLSNGQGDLFVGRTNQDGQGPATISIRRGLIYFDVAAEVPAGATILSVTFSMRDVMGLNGDHPADLHRLLQDWGEGASFFQGGQGAPPENGDATWLYTFYNSADPGSSPTWTTPGGDFASQVSGTATISDDLGGGQTFTWASSPGMVADVQSWLDNPASNFGWLIQGNESAGQTAKRLNSRESAFAPQLTVEYVPEPGGLALAATGMLLLLLGTLLRRRLSSVQRPYDQTMSGGTPV